MYRPIAPVLVQCMTCEGSGEHNDHRCLRCGGAGSYYLHPIAGEIPQRGYDGAEPYQGSDRFALVIAGAIVIAVALCTFGVLMLR